MSEKPYESAIVITPSDTTILEPTRALYIGGVGDVTAIMKDGRSALFSAVPVGTILPIECTKVMSTGTGATLILGLW
jgi:hypothetical protein